MADSKSLSLQEFLSLSDHEERILIVSDVSKGNTLIRMYEKNADMVRNISCENINRIADTICEYELSKKGYDIAANTIDDDEALMLFRHCILFKCIDDGELKYFTNEDILDIATTQELFRKVNLVRCNGWIEELKIKSGARLEDLALLTCKYENYLRANNISDRASRIINAVSIVKAWGANSEQELNYAFNAELSYLKEDAERFSGIQNELIELICVSGYNVSFCLNDNTSESQNMILDGIKDKTEFYRGYGSFNEANYVAYDILNKKYPFGQVTLLYSSESQLPAISAALCGNKIPMKIVSSHSADSNSIVVLAKRIFSWAADNFSEKGLEMILTSPDLISITEKHSSSDGKEYDKNIVRFDFVLNARGRREDSFTLGWGYKRNCDFLVHELDVLEKSNIKDKEPMRKLLGMYKSLLVIFDPEAGETYSASAVAIRLLEFINDYTEWHDDSYDVGVGLIKKISVGMKYDDSQYTLKQICDIFDEMLSSARIADTEEKPKKKSKSKTNDDTKIVAEENTRNSSVIVMSMNGWIPLDRQYIYMTGLSLAEVQGNTTESPVLSDKEMDSLPRNGFIPTTKNNAEEREKSFYRTISTFAGEQIVLGYSFYDTVKFSMNNASSFYINALKQIKGMDASIIPEFVYGDDKSGVFIKTFVGSNLAVFPKDKWPTSKAQMESFLSCPKKFAYSDYRVLGIPETDYFVPNPKEWMNAAQKGTYFHSIAEKYCNEVLNQPSSVLYPDDVNEDKLHVIADTVEKEMINEIQPEIIKGLGDREKEKFVDAALTYFRWLHKDLNTTGWRILASELRFDSAKFKINDYLGNSYEFSMNGYFDRLDYKLDKAAKKVHLRIADYKSGKKANQKTKLDNGTLIQHTIYAEALKSGQFALDKDKNNLIPLNQYILSEIAKLEGDIDITSWVEPLIFDSFSYEFPVEKIEDHSITISSAELVGMANTRLSAILTTITETGSYPDVFELFNALSEPVNGCVERFKATDQLLESLPEFLGTKTDNGLFKTKTCEHCKYVDLCLKKKAGDII